MEKYNIIGMSCAACVARVKKAVEAIEGVSEAIPNHKKIQLLFLASAM